MIAFNKTQDRIVAGKVIKADTPATRAKGLLGRDSLTSGEGMWIVPCAMIHTFFMRFNLDILFFNRDLEVVRVQEDMKPWRMSPWVWKAHSVLELAGGSLQGSVRRGDRFEFK